MLVKAPQRDWFEANGPTLEAGPVATAPGPTGLQNAAGRGVPIQQFVDDYRNNFGLRLRQSDPAGWTQLLNALHTEGYTNAKLDTRADGMHKGILVDGSDGSFVKLADGNDNPIWLPGGDAPNTGGGTLGGGTLLQPFGEDFSRPTFQPPPDFVAPTGDQVFEDPGFQFRLDQGRQALERSAAAKGTLLTTGTLKDLDSFNQSAASQEYGNVYARKAGEYESKYGKAVDSFSRDYNQALGEYSIKKGNFYDNQDRPFNKLTTLAGFGAQPSPNYAGQYGSLMMTGANNQGNYLTQGANGQAAGLVGGANAYTNAFGNLANLGAQYASIYNNPWSQRQRSFPAGGYPTSLSGFGGSYW